MTGAEETVVWAIEVAICGWLGLVVIGYWLFGLGE